MPVGQLGKEIRYFKYEHIATDTEANPGDADSEDIAKGCDLLVVPTEPDSTVAASAT